MWILYQFLLNIRGLPGGIKCVQLITLFYILVHWFLICFNSLWISSRYICNFWWLLCYFLWHEILPRHCKITFKHITSIMVVTHFRLLFINKLSSEYFESLKPCSIEVSRTFIHQILYNWRIAHFLKYILCFLNWLFWNMGHRISKKMAQSRS